MPALHIITNRFPATPDDQASPFVRDFAVAVAESGVDVEITTPAYSPARQDPSGVLMNWIPWTGSKEVIGETNPLNPWDVLAVLRFLRAGKNALLKALAERPADHCLALWALPSGWLARYARGKMGTPYSVWCLGSDIYVWAGRPIIGRVIRGVLRDAKFLFADGNDLRSRTERVSGRDCGFLPSLRLLPRAPLPETNHEREESDFIYVGRYEKSKGVFLVLEAFAAARVSCPSITLGLLGWGPEEDRLKETAGRLGFGDAVRFLGRGGPTEVARVMSAGRCLLIPSYGDSIPLVFGEALQAKTPLIVTDVGDLGSLTREHRLGSVVNKGDVRALAEAMVGMASQGPPGGYEERMDGLLASFHPQVAARKFLDTVFGR